MNDATNVLDTHQKALELNLDPNKYGTLAEIGGGQEVARWFFRVGGASGTVAKTMSAYDMSFSDAIYGPCDRYVSRQRLSTMLDREYSLLVERLAGERGSQTQFFAFADTVRTRSFDGKRNGHGWLGIKFQTAPEAPPSTILIHLQLWGKDPIQDQEALGAFGVNLIYGAYMLHDDPDRFLKSLADSLPPGRVEVDVVEFDGPSFDQLDNRLMCLKLVAAGLGHASIFDADGAMIEPSELFYKKPIMVQRGSFRNLTPLTKDMLNCAVAQFVQEPNVDEDNLVILQEISLSNLTHNDDGIDSRDFLERVDRLRALGRPVMISNYGEFHRFAAYLFRYTREMIGIAIGVPTLREIFKEHYYRDLAGGILESFGRLFKNDLKLYAYPSKQPKSGALITAGNLRVDPHLRHLYQYLYENQFILGLRDYDPNCLDVETVDVGAPPSDRSSESLTINGAPLTPSA